jgi:hypothetical protein
MPNFCPQREFIFIHIPRTAGGSMEHAIKCSGGNEGGISLGNYKNGHAQLAWYPEHMIKYFFKFSIIRNPWDRIFSIYKWKTKNLSRESFEDFLITTRESSNFTHKWHIGFLNQLDYLIYKNNITINHILRFETLEQDFTDFQKRYPLIAARPLIHTHKTQAANYKDYYTNKSLDVVRRLFQKDIKYFGYEF